MTADTRRPYQAPAILQTVVLDAAECGVELAREGSVYFRLLENGSAIAVYPLGGGNLQVALVTAGGIDDVYYYSTQRHAIEAASAWHGIGEPTTGWHRHPPSGRRREGGDPTKETVRF